MRTRLSCTPAIKKPYLPFMSTPITDEQLLLKCRKLIAEKLTWPPAAEWHNSQYNQLSEKILAATGVGLNTATLKKLFGNEEHTGLPNLSTLNPIVTFLGYDNWAHFKSEQSIPTSPLGALMGKESDRAKLRSMNPFYMGVALVALIILCAFLFLRK